MKWLRSLDPLVSDRRRRDRTGSSVIECVVAASVLMVTMGTVTTMAFRASRIWIATGHQRIAMNELSNQLETITSARGDEINRLIENLAPSGLAQKSLDQPLIKATRTRDQAGDRVTIELSWRSQFPIAPVSLTGWISVSAEDPAP